MKRWTQASEAMENQTNSLQANTLHQQHITSKKEFCTLSPIIQNCVSYAKLLDTKRLFRRLSQLLSFDH